MGPERTVEMQRLEAGPLERLVQVRVPVGPELNNGEECLQDGLVLPNDQVERAQLARLY